MANVGGKGLLNDGVYLHDIVVHQQNFVDPLQPNVHTKNIENRWMRPNRGFQRQFGTTRALFSTYFWRYRVDGASPEPEAPLSFTSYMHLAPVTVGRRRSKRRNQAVHFRANPFAHKGSCTIHHYILLI